MVGDAIPWEVVTRPASAPQHDQLGEGPVWDADAGVLWWVDIAKGRVQRLTPDTGQVEGWDVGVHASAVVPCASGGVLLAGPDGLSRFDALTDVRTPFGRPDPDPLNRANECRVDPQGRLWLGTMSNNLGPDGVSRPLRGATGGLFRVDTDGGSQRVLAGVGIANTLVWSPDGAILYFADSLRGVIWRFPFHGDTGALGERSVFVGPGDAPGAPDGSAMDENGCLWNARWGAGRVIRFTPDGRIDREVVLPAAQPTCPAFGGVDRRTLYVTSARQDLGALSPQSLDGALFAMSVAVPGGVCRPFAG